MVGEGGHQYVGVKVIGNGGSIGGRGKGGSVTEGMKKKTPGVSTRKEYK